MSKWTMKVVRICPVCKQNNVVNTGYRGKYGRIWKCTDCGKLLEIKDGRIHGNGIGNEGCEQGNV